MKINKGYASLTPAIGRAKYFLEQGNVIPHWVDRFKWHVLPKFHIAPPFPTHLDIESSSRCQLRCPMCTQNLMDESLRGDMDFGLYQKIIDEAAKKGVYSIKLSWRGEPLLNKNIWEMVEYAKKEGIKDVAFLSNGEKLKEGDLERMINSGLDWVSFSIDGLGDIYEKIRAPARFEEISRKLELLKRLKDKKSTAKPLVRVQSIFSAIRDDPQEYFDYWKERADRVNFISDDSRAEKERNFQQDPTYVCPSPWQRMVISYDGNVMPCVCDYFLGNSVGNVMNQSLYDIWHSSEFKKIRDLQKNRSRLEMESCRKCCQGGLSKETEIVVGDKKQKITKYLNQKSI